MTADEINALPEPVRRYIHDLETRCDPAGDLRRLQLLEDENRQLRAALTVLQESLRRANDALDTAHWHASRDDDGFGGKR